MPHLRKPAGDNCVSCAHSDVRIIHRPIPVTPSAAGISPFELVAPRSGAAGAAPRAKQDLDTTPISHWFHGSISREDTERLLRQLANNGTFLIRFSTSTHKYVLSVIYNQQLYHYPIEELPDGFYQVRYFNPHALP